MEVKELVVIRYKQKNYKQVTKSTREFMVFGTYDIEYAEVCVFGLCRTEKKEAY